jgi:hypothetical protein
MPNGLVMHVQGPQHISPSDEPHCGVATTAAAAAARQRPSVPHAARRGRRARSGAAVVDDFKSIGNHNTPFHPYPGRRKRVGRAITKFPARCR